MYTIAYCVQYTFTRVHARIPNGQPREDPREEKRACRWSRRTSRRGCRACPARGKLNTPDTPTSVRGSSRRRAEVREDVRVGPMEIKLNKILGCRKKERATLCVVIGYATLQWHSWVRALRSPNLFARRPKLKKIIK